MMTWRGADENSNGGGSKEPATGNFRLAGRHMETLYWFITVKYTRSLQFSLLSAPAFFSHFFHFPFFLI